MESLLAGLYLLLDIEAFDVIALEEVTLASQPVPTDNLHHVSSPIETSLSSLILSLPTTTSI